MTAILLLGTGLSAQDYKFGIRAGLNLGRFNGPTIDNEMARESNSYSTGFHFGITWDYYLTDAVAIKTELLYIQHGTQNRYQGDGYYKIYLDDETTLVDQGAIDRKLNISNAYLTIPLMISGEVGKKWEVFGGVYGSLLVQPTGTGTFNYLSNENSDGIRFTQSLDYNYRNDVERSFSNRVSPILLLVDGEQTPIAKVAGAYYQFDEGEKSTNYVNRFDAGVIGGFNYFINKGFYIGARAQYGFADITDNSVDRVLTSLNSDGSIIASDDRDQQIAFQASFGFKF